MSSSSSIAVIDLPIDGYNLDVDSQRSGFTGENGELPPGEATVQLGVKRPYAYEVGTDDAVAIQCMNSVWMDWSDEGECRESGECIGSDANCTESILCVFRL